MNWESVITFIIPVAVGALVLLAVVIRNRILWNRMKARHLREWEAMVAETDAMFAELDRQWDEARRHRTD